MKRVVDLALLLGFLSAAAAEAQVARTRRGEDVRPGLAR